MATSTEALDAATPAHPWLFRRGQWDLREAGAATYRGVRFPTDGAERKLLCRLVKARGTALSYAELMDALGNGLMSFETLKSYASRLRNLLRRALGHLGGFPPDPLPNVDGMAYRLDLRG
jgi:hypothetical protein